MIATFMAWYKTGPQQSMIDWSIARDTMVESSRVDIGWVIFGLAAQGLFLAGLAGHWFATRKKGRIFLPPSVVSVGLVASVMLMIYASVRHDIVFVVGQILNMMIGFRLLELVSKINASAPLDETKFPEVRPDAADRSRVIQRK